MDFLGAFHRQILANFSGRQWTNMDFTYQMSQPVKAIHLVWEPDGKVPQKARVEGTFLQVDFLQQAMRCPLV
jgi:hypothetical protein